MIDSEALISLTGILAWPVTAILLVLIFYKPLQRLLSAAGDKLESGTTLGIGLVRLGARLSTASAHELERKLFEELPSQWLHTGGEGNGGMTPVIRFMNIKNAVLTELAEKIRVPTIRDIKPTQESKAVFDGIAMDQKGLRITEVKVLCNAATASKRIRQFLDHVARFRASVDDDNKASISVILAIVFASDFEGDKQSAVDSIIQVRNDYPFFTQLDMHDESSLLKSRGKAVS